MRVWGLAILSLVSCSAGFTQYVRSEACRSCHPAKFETQSKTGHAHALALAPAGSPGHWAFGAGEKAITYVSQIDEDWYVEHGLSYYPAKKAMGLTPGHNNSEGRRYRTFEAVATTLRCFRCHSTGVPSLGSGGTIQPFELGVRCESCHGLGSAHVKSAGTIRNPGKLSAAELNEYCGSCHRKTDEDMTWSNSWNVRHQPSYLSQAACFRKSDGKLSCLTCHDPHSPLNRVAADYDKRCSGCHAQVRHRTAVAARACVDCHMPQVPTGNDLHFTNHWIGIYEKGRLLAPVRRAKVPPLQVVRLDAPPADTSELRALFEQALAGRERELGPKHAKVARSAADLGLFLKSIGDPLAALAPLSKALDIDEANGDPMLAADQENLAATLGGLGKNNAALDLFQQASKGADNAVAARSFSTLASLDPQQAESYYRQALQREEAASGKEHPRVAVILNNLGLELRRKNDNRGAEPLFRRAYAIQQKAFGAESPVTALTLINLGSLLQSTGRLVEAERLERSAVRIFEAQPGPEIVELAAACTNLAELLWTKGARVEATRLYRRAISIDEAVYGQEHPEVAGDLTNLGLLLKEAGDRAAADPLLRRALAIYEKAFGAGSAQATEVREQIGRR